MRQHKHILRVGVAIALLLLSNVIRSYDHVSASPSCEQSVFFTSDNDVSYVLSPQENTYSLSLICEDDNSDDDDSNDNYLLSYIKRSPRVLLKENSYTYCLQFVASSIFFFSDTSPPLV